VAAKIHLKGGATSKIVIDISSVTVYYIPKKYGNDKVEYLKRAIRQ
jgi:hypothetical protein